MKSGPFPGLGGGGGRADGPGLAHVGAGAQKREQGQAGYEESASDSNAGELSVLAGAPDSAFVEVLSVEVGQ